MLYTVMQGESHSTFKLARLDNEVRINWQMILIDSLGGYKVMLLL